MSTSIRPEYQSPALFCQSEYYPASWRGRVPKRVRMAQRVTPDFPASLFHSTKVAHKDAEYAVYVNSHGAVSAILPDGQLGLRPYEFDVIEWHEIVGPTHWVICLNPPEHPDQWGLWRFCILAPNCMVREERGQVRETYVELIRLLPGGLRKTERLPGENPAVYEVWI